MSGGIASIPTDTVYGLAALATDSRAIAGLVEAKGRASDQPIAVLFDSIAAIARHLADPHVLDQVAPFWPGGLTVVVRAAPDSPIVQPVVSEGGTIGIRKPDDALARTVIRACGGVLAVSSANRHGEPAAISADEVIATFGELLPVLDGGDRRDGLASTVLDLTVDPPRILREGAVDVSTLVEGDAGTDAPETGL